VYPGSDLDTFRTFRDRNKVVLGGRKGFLKLALRERVPIVPVVTAGTHEQMLVLSRGDRLARLVHAHAWARTEVLPLILAVPWGLTLGFVPYLPLPAQTTQVFLPPMTWPELGPEAAESPADLERCYLEVEVAMQAAMDRIHARAPVPARPAVLGNGPDRPHLVEEGAQLLVEPLGPDPPLVDRARRDQPCVRELARDPIGIAERMDRIRRVADHESRVRQRAPRVDRRRDPAEDQAIEHGERSGGIASHEVDQDIDQEVAARDPAGQRRDEPHRPLTHPQCKRERHERGGRGRERVLEHGHLEHQRTNAAGAATAASSATFAPSEVRR